MDVCTAVFADDARSEGPQNVLRMWERQPPAGAAALGTGYWTYWSSRPSPRADTDEWMAVRLVHPLCVLRSVEIVPYQADRQEVRMTAHSNRLCCVKGDGLFGLCRYPSCIEDAGQG